MGGGFLWRRPDPGAAACGLQTAVEAAFRMLRRIVVVISPREEDLLQVVLEGQATSSRGEEWRGGVEERGWGGSRSRRTRRSPTPGPTTAPDRLPKPNKSPRQQPTGQYGVAARLGKHDGVRESRRLRILCLVVPETGPPPAPHLPRAPPPRRWFPGPQQHSAVPDGAHHGRVPPAAIDPTRGLAANSASLLLGGHCSCKIPIAAPSQPHRSPIASSSPALPSHRHRTTDRKDLNPPGRVNRGERGRAGAEIWETTGSPGQEASRGTPHAGRSGPRPLPVGLSGSNFCAQPESLTQAPQ